MDALKMLAGLSVAIFASGGCAQIPMQSRAPAISAETAAIAARLDPVIDEAVAEGFGGQVAILKDGALLYSASRGFADNEGRTTVTGATHYQVASLTKYFTAILVLRAVEEGRLDLDAAAPALFPGSSLKTRDFTLRDLLAHESGLRSTYAAETQADSAAAADAIAEANRDNATDGDFHYSNDGYDLLAILIERAFGAPYETVFREKIAEPAGISSVGFWGEGRLDDPTYRGQPLKREDENIRRRNYGMLGSAGLLASAEDLVRFEKALTEGRIISPASLETLRAPRRKISIGRTAYGSFLVETPLGLAASARGSEDWGDNAYLNDYEACGFIVAVTTSKGPAEASGEPLFRDQIIKPIEEILAPDCAHEP